MDKLNDKVKTMTAMHMQTYQAIVFARPCVNETAGTNKKRLMVW